MKEMNIAVRNIIRGIIPPGTLALWASPTTYSAVPTASVALFILHAKTRMTVAIIICFIPWIIADSVSSTVIVFVARTRVRATATIANEPQSREVAESALLRMSIAPQGPSHAALPV
ncbi:116aa long hypothetical protein [Pyrococcus horikoshii OT3]|uniref:Uncharacterized protein n=1 Tax=Pyrococcus horikoshii (strain ATCC 700860 / DSM 12428 / JCM 9974 / NBRC 100139 / OT-3) TaxID=70601 RepID=O59531_PYRHO|nr:116aa long hypothetical protein [Pyrococcus horikoshii OT3]